MIVYRLVKKKYGFALSGEGARLAGGRWNSIELPLIYTSDSRALCTAEVAVSLPFGIIPTDYLMLIIEIPDEIPILEINTSDLPDNWREFPYSNKTIRFGDQFFFDKRFTVMKVPSAVVPGDYNYLLNPLHPDFGKIKIIKQEPYEFDERFFKI